MVSHQTAEAASADGIVQLVSMNHAGDLITDYRPLIPVFRRPGGFSGEPVPDPIPNSAVKLPCADGTKPQGLEE